MKFTFHRHCKCLQVRSRLGRQALTGATIRRRQRCFRDLTKQLVVLGNWVPNGTKTGKPNVAFAIATPSPTELAFRENASQRTDLASTRRAGKELVVHPSRSPFRPVLYDLGSRHGCRDGRIHAVGRTCLALTIRARHPKRIEGARIAEPRSTMRANIASAAFG